MRTIRTTVVTAVALCITVAALLSAPPALAGPPLVCHPFQIGEAKTLPWDDSSKSWKAASPAYDTTRLGDDTLGILTPQTPIVVRMETLRRAGLYAVKDQRAGGELLSRLVARTKANTADATTASLAWFDLGYFIETVKQAEHGPAVPIATRILGALGLASSDARMKTMGDLDGYEMVTRALSMRGTVDPEMEYAAALISSYPRRASHEGHLTKAVAGAEEGTLLAKNLVTNFGDRGHTLSELRSSVGLTATPRTSAR